VNDRPQPSASAPNPPAVPQILFVDDEPKACSLFARFAEQAGLATRCAGSAEEALRHLEQITPSLIISDLRLPGASGVELLQQVRSRHPRLPFVIITGFSTLDDAIGALRLGADDFIKKPYDVDELIALSQRLLAECGTAPPRPSTLDGSRFGLLGNSQGIRDVLRVLDKIRDVRVNVMIEGESGVGKELVARAVHHRSLFADQPFVVIDCGALTDSLLESELFGHEKGAFTGADKQKRGLLEMASGGTVFLDEIGNISDAMQVKLLRVVQEQQVTRVGGVRPFDIDVRFVVASNRDLAHLVEQGQFRHDLYHRLNVVKIRVPPLRQRREDIRPLAEHFLAEFASRYRRPARLFDQETLQQLEAYDWPGNVRELKNLTEQLVALSDGPSIHLDRELGQGPATPRPPTAAGWPRGDADSPRAQAPTDALEARRQALAWDWPSLETLERRYVRLMLERYHDSREQTAKALGINKSTLWRKLQAWEE